MDESNIFLEVKLTVEDVYNFNKAHLNKRVPLALRIVICIISIGLAISSLLESINGGVFQFWSVFFPIVLVIILIELPRMLKKSSKTAFETNKLLQKTQSYMINSEYIRITSSSAETNLKWDELYKASETKESFQFFISKHQMYIVPKRYFLGEEEKIDILKSYIRKVPTPKDEKKGIFSLRNLGIGCLLYVVMFFVVLSIVKIYLK